MIPRLFGFPCHFPARPSIVAAKYMILLGFTALGEPRKNFCLSFPARQGKIEGTRSIAMVRPSDLKPVALEGGFSLDRDLAPEPVFERAQRVGCVAGQRRCDIRRDRQTPTSPGLRSRFAAQRAQRLVRDGDRGLDERAARARLEERLGERTPAPRPHQFEVAQPSPAENLRTRRVGRERLGKRVAYAISQPALRPRRQNR